MVEGEGLRFAHLGTTFSDKLEFGGYRPGDSSYLGQIPLADLRAAHEGFFPALMQGEL